jgi:hypothetical protein
MTVSVEFLNPRSMLHKLPNQLQNAQFAFIINGTALASGTVESVVLSPAVHALLAVDPCAKTFTIRDPRLEASAFGQLLQCAGGAPPPPPSARDSLARLCFHLCNPALFHRLFPDLLSRLSEVPALALDFDFLDDLLSRNSLPLDSEDSLFDFLAGLPPEFSPLFRHVRPEFLSARARACFADKLFAMPLAEPFWKSSTDALTILTLFDSRIVDRMPPFPEFAGKAARLLYRGSRDGFAAASFHRLCDGHGSTAVLVATTGGFVLGGFTPVPWDSSGRYLADDSGRSFVFSLSRPLGAEPRQFPVRPNGRRHAICGDRARGPRFGYDLSIGDCCDLGDRSSASYFGSTYDASSVRAPREFFTGTQCFTVRELEVFALAG